MRRSQMDDYTVESVVAGKDIDIRGRQMTVLEVLKPDGHISPGGGFAGGVIIALIVRGIISARSLILSASNQNYLLLRGYWE